MVGRLHHQPVHPRRPVRRHGLCHRSDRRLDHTGPARPGRGARLSAELRLLRDGQHVRRQGRRHLDVRPPGLAVPLHRGGPGRHLRLPGSPGQARWPSTVFRSASSYSPNGSPTRRGRSPRGWRKSACRTSSPSVCWSPVVGRSTCSACGRRCGSCTSPACWVLIPILSFLPPPRCSPATSWSLSNLHWDLSASGAPGWKTALAWMFLRWPGRCTALRPWPLSSPNSVTPSATARSRCGWPASSSSPSTSSCRSVSAAWSIRPTLLPTRSPSTWACSRRFSRLVTS